MPVLSNCRYATDRGWTTPDDRPCPKTHCALKHGCAEHVDTTAGVYTCPACIGRVRADLDRIQDLAARMPLEAENTGIDSEAFNLAGPAASVDQLDARRRLADRDRGWCEWPQRNDDAHHPYAVLGRWDLTLRERYGPATDLFVTIPRAADFLRSLLAGGFPHTRAFEEFARDLARCRTHLEQVIHDSRAPELGAPCPTCAANPTDDAKPPRLLKRYARHTALARGQQCHLVVAGKHCRTCAGLNDTWHCPVDPGHWWTDAEYRLRVGADYLEHAAALTADQAAERFGIKASVIRVWGSRDLVRKRGRDSDGITLYDVEDIATRLTARDGEVLAPTAGRV